ncbi:hypothetical protein AAMO2058_000369700 [Amorphochlora amoebiformis]
MQSIRVLIRVRPQLGFEKDQKCYNYLQLYPNGARNSIRICIPSKGGPDHSRTGGGAYTKNVVAHEFTFDSVMSEKANQADIFRESGGDYLVENVLKGFNATVFAYGQTGSGKTFTMDGLQYCVHETKKGKRTKVSHSVKMGDVKDQGFVFRCIDRLFNRVEEMRVRANEGDSMDNTDRVYTIKCSFLQIYNENVHDLLAPVAKRRKGEVTKGMRIRWKKREGFFVENLFKNECDSAQSCKNFFVAGVSNRTVASHSLNAHSSRSHSIFTIYLSSAPKTHPEMETVSNMHIVDLAGSERVKDTGATGKLLKQSIGINRSLFVLRKVIKTLSRINRKIDALQKASQNLSRKQRVSSMQSVVTLRKTVPYRDSVLTRLLKNALGGNSFTVMIACMGPRDAVCEENFSTLKYASLAKSISNKAVINADPRTQLIQSLQEEVRMMRAQLLRSTQVNKLEADLTVNVAQRERVSKTFDIVNASSQDHEVGQNLVESVRLIKEVIEDNNNLRDKVNHGIIESAQLSAENQNLNKENAELRHQVQFYQNLLENKAYPRENEKNDLDSDDESDDSVDITPLITPKAVLQDLFRQASKPEISQISSHKTPTPPPQAVPREKERAKFGGLSMSHNASPRPSSMRRRESDPVTLSSRTCANRRSMPRGSGKKVAIYFNRNSRSTTPRISSRSRIRITSQNRRYDRKGRARSPSKLKSRPFSNQDRAKVFSAPVRRPWGKTTYSSREQFRHLNEKAQFDEPEATIPMVELARLFEERSKMIS